jgi:hypothetical protein
MSATIRAVATFRAAYSTERLGNEALDGKTVPASATTACAYRVNNFADFFLIIAGDETDFVWRARQRKIPIGRVALGTSRAGG